MKFKQNQELEQESQIKMNKDLYEAFIDLIQFEINKIGIIESAKFYFYKNGLMSYKKFFKYLWKNCNDIKMCLISYVMEHMGELPEFTINSIKADFENPIEPFKILASKEDEYCDKLTKMIDLAFENKEWSAFKYLLEKLNKIDHICCRALAAVEHDADVSDLIPCESHI